MYLIYAVKCEAGTADPYSEYWAIALDALSAFLCGKWLFLLLFLSSSNLPSKHFPFGSFLGHKKSFQKGFKFACSFAK